MARINLIWTMILVLAPGLFNIQDKFGLSDRKPEARPDLLAHVV